jgi:hypothetical protein
MKKTFLLSLILIFMLACVITPPEGLLDATPTICVECVQATICAENVGDEECPVSSSATPIDALPTLIPSTQETVPTKETTEAVLTTETIEALLSITPEISPSKTESVAVTLNSTSTRTLTSAKTQTPTKTETLTPTATKTIIPSSTIDHGNWVYKTQTGSPKYSTNFAHPNLACNWSGVAGQIFGPGGAPQSDVVVVITGAVNGVPYDLLGFSGSAVLYGASAFEVEFPDGPVKTTDSLVIQLFDLEGNALSAAFPFDTFTDCDKNLIVFNFVLSN